MRISDWSSDVCSSDLGAVLMTGEPEAVRADCRVQEVYTGTGTPVVTGRAAAGSAAAATDRTSGVSGKSVSGRVDIGGRRIINNKNEVHTTTAMENTAKHMMY